MALNNNNFLLHAMKNYDMKLSTSVDEFSNDLKRFQYLKRLFNRYKESEDLQLRLILNHIIVLYNCFGPATTTMLFFKLQDKEFHKYLKTILIFLERVPRVVYYEDKAINMDSIDIDENIDRELRNHA